jgi:hypothetical protein
MESQRFAGIPAYVKSAPHGWLWRELADLVRRETEE